MKIAILGNSPTNAGVAMAADLSLAGHDVRFARWTEAEVDFAAILRSGGIEVTGNSRHLVSGKLGVGKPALCDDLAQAVKGAALVVLDFPPADLETRLTGVAPLLSGNQVVHINTNSYWSAFRAWPIIQKTSNPDIVITEIISPTITTDYRGAQITTKYLRQRLPVAALPARKRDFAMEKLRVVCPSLVPARSVLQTSFANLNFLAHPAIALLNIGWFDRSKSAGEEINFWLDGTTPNAALLSEAQDQERRHVSDAYGVPWLSTARHLGETYGGSATGFRDAIQQCEFYRSLPKRNPEMWRRWLSADVPLAHVPFVEVARLARVETPIHEAYITAFSVLLGSDFRRDGLTLKKLNLENRSMSDLIAYADTGSA